MQNNGEIETKKTIIEMSRSY